MVPSTSKSSPLDVFSQLRVENLIAGITGGVVSTVVLHPLDLLKIRFAVNDGQLLTRPTYHGLANAVSTIVRDEGIRGLYRGVIPNCFGAGASWGLYFLFYDAIKKYMLNEQRKSTLSAGSHMIAAAEAGAVTLVFTNPIWVVKTRMCLQYSATSNLPSSKHYSSMSDALVKVYRHEGFSGMYKGFVPGLLNVSHGSLQFMAYEEIKKKYCTHYQLPVDEKLGPVQYLSFAAMSKLFAATITYPYQVVRARLQDQHKEYRGLLHVVGTTWRLEGMKGFYKGLIPNLMKVVPGVCITFLVYENLLFALKERKL